MSQKLYSWCLKIHKKILIQLLTDLHLFKKILVSQLWGKDDAV